MSTNKTQNLNLHSWVETDPVLMSEFNENFNALDAAAQTFGNCKIITGSYVGDGTTTKTLYFPSRPLLVFVHWSMYLGIYHSMRFIPGATIIMNYASHMSSTEVSASWSDNTLTWEPRYADDTAEEILNKNAYTYNYIAIV